MTTTLKLGCYIFSLMILSCGPKSEESIYLIPRDYVGNILIIFNQKDGTDMTHERRARLYTLDSSGVIRTKFPPNYGVHKNHYYYVDTYGTRTDLKYALYSHFKDTNEVAIFNHEVGKDFDFEKGASRHFELFTIGKMSNIDSLSELKSRFMSQNLNPN